MKSLRTVKFLQVLVGKNLLPRAVLMKRNPGLNCNNSHSNYFSARQFEIHKKENTAFIDFNVQRKI